VPSCREAVAGAPSLQNHLCTDCTEHFGVVRDSLEQLDVAYEIDQRLVRGLDYYTRTIFEIQTGTLGAQSAIAGGGRYDGLIHALGGPKMPAVGFAIGFDRLVELAQRTGSKRDGTVDLFVAALGEKSQRIALNWASKLSNEGVCTELDLSGKSLKSLMKRADRIGAVHVMIAGDSELAQEAVIVRNMATKEQITVPFANLISDIKQLVATDA